MYPMLTSFFLRQLIYNFDLLFAINKEPNHMPIVGVGVGVAYVHAPLPLISEYLASVGPLMTPSRTMGSLGV